MDRAFDSLTRLSIMIDRLAFRPLDQNPQSFQFAAQSPNLMLEALQPIRYSRYGCIGPCFVFWLRLGGFTTQPMVVTGFSFPRQRQHPR